MQTPGIRYGIQGQVRSGKPQRPARDYDPCRCGPVGCPAIHFVTSEVSRYRLSPTLAIKRFAVNRMPLNKAPKPIPKYMNALTLWIRISLFVALVSRLLAVDVDEVGVVSQAARSRKVTGPEFRSLEQCNEALRPKFNTMSASEASLFPGLTEAWPAYNAGRDLSLKSLSDSREVVIPGVPNYLWYLNCGLTSWTMIVGYWNDHGYPGLIPGGSSVTGNFWATTEEIFGIIDMPDAYPFPATYAQLSEYGLDYQFSFSLFATSWEAYTNAIETYHAPLLVGWHGPPYTPLDAPIGHTTVGVGYKVENNQRFMILHDTWADTPVYVDYDKYGSSLTQPNAFGVIFPTPGAVSSYDPPPALSAEGTLVFTPRNMNLDPPLDPSVHSYHSIEVADFNGDGRPDLLIADFRNEVSPYRILMLYTNAGNRFVWDASFAPKFNSGVNVWALKIVDCGSDGFPDLAIGSYWSKPLVYLNHHGIITNTPIEVDQILGGTDLAWGDIDLDGSPDLAVLAAASVVRFYHNDGNAFTYMSRVYPGDGSVTKIALRDLMGSPHPELIVSKRDGSVLIYENMNGTFAHLQQPAFAPAGHGAMSFDVGDIDHDGSDEIITVDDGQLVLFRKEKSVFSPSPHYLGLPTMYAKDICLQDLDGDEYPELLVGTYNGQDAIFANDAGTFRGIPVWVSSKVQSTVRVRAYEFSSDGRKTVAFLRPRGGSIEFFDVAKRPALTVKKEADAVVFTIKDLIPGRMYSVEQADGIGSSSWNTAFSFVSSGIQTNWTEAAVPDQSNAFYRALAQ
jgi:hypothetical protein